MADKDLLHGNVQTQNNTTLLRFESLAHLYIFKEDHLSRLAANDQPRELIFPSTQAHPRNRSRMRGKGRRHPRESLAQ